MVGSYFVALDLFSEELNPLRAHCGDFFPIGIGELLTSEKTHTGPHRNLPGGGGGNPLC